MASVNALQCDVAYLLFQAFVHKQKIQKISHNVN